MSASCGARCAKGWLVTFNLIFWISGCFLLSTGIYLLIDKDNNIILYLFHVPGLSYAFIQYLAWALVGIGSVIFAVGFCGCFGAVRENRFMLVTFFIFLFLVMIGELAVGILSVIFQDQTLDRLTSLSNTLKDEYGINGQITEAFDLAQTNFNCCGVLGPDDYKDSEWKLQDLGKGDHVSKTCCVLSNKDHMHPRPVNSTLCQQQQIVETVPYRHEQGCLSKLEEFIKQNSIILVAIGCGVGALEIFGMISALCLCKEI